MLESGLGEWTIRAYVDDNGDWTLQATESTVAAETETAEGGAYQFDLDNGDYVLCEVSQAGWVQSEPHGGACASIAGLAGGGYAIAVGNSTVHTNRDFGNYQRGNPNGTKFHDLNADGDRDPFEPGLEAWTILAYADDNGDGTLQASETTIADSKLTAVDGTYQLSLDPGHYVVCEQNKATWIQSHPSNQACAAIAGLAPGGHALTVQSGVAVNEPNFGNYQRGNPNGTKFHDLNADGDRDPFEPGLGGLDDPRLRRRQRRRHPAGLRDDDRRLEADRRRRHLPALAGPRPLRRLRAKQGDLDPVPSLKPGLRRDRRPRPRRPRPDGSKRRRRQRAELRQLPARQPQRDQVPRPERRR